MGLPLVTTEIVIGIRNILLVKIHLGLYFSVYNKFYVTRTMLRKIKQIDFH